MRAAPGAGTAAPRAGGCGPLLRDPAERIAALLLGLYFVAFLAYAIVAQRALAADGVNYVINIAARHGFAFEEPGRRAAEILYQWPAVLAVRLGVQDLELLGRLFAAGCYASIFLTLAAGWALLPGGRKPLMLFPVLAILLGWLTGCYSALLEVHALSFWFWPVLFAVLFRPLARWRDVALLLALSLPMVLLYPTVVVLAPPLAGLALRRWLRRPADRHRGAWLVLALWFVLVTAVAIHLILVPRDLANRDNLAAGILGLAFLAAGDGVNWPLVLALVTMPLLLACAWRPDALRRRLALWLPPYLGLAAFTALSPVVAVSSFAPGLQLEARAWEGVLPVLLLPALLAHLAGRLGFAAGGRRLALAILAMLAVAQITWQIAATAQWAGRLSLLRGVLAAKEGLIPFEQTPLGLPRIGMQAVAALDWPWTDPLLSIFLAPGGRVAAIVAAPRGYGGWQPFDPARPETLPRVPGIDYSLYRAALAGAAGATR